MVLYYSPRRLSFIIAALIALLTISSSSVVSAFGSDKSSLFTNSRCVVDLDRSRLTFVTPAADACPWVVLFYDSMCGHCREFAGPFAEMAEKYLIAKGVLVGAVNCASNEAICTASNVTSVPAIMIGSPSALFAEGKNNNNNNNKVVQQLLRRDDSKENNGQVLFDVEQKKMIDELIRDVSPYIKKNSNALTSSVGSSPMDVRKSNSRQKWRVVTNELSEDTPDGKLLDYVKKAVNDEVTISSDNNKNAMCRDVVATLCLKKKKMIDFRTKNEKQKVKKTLFTLPSNHPCPQDLIGAFYIAMKHEVFVAFSSALTNALLSLPKTENKKSDAAAAAEAAAASTTYQNLLHALYDFLNSLDSAIPELGASEVIEALRSDPLAPTKFDWGFKIFQILNRRHGGDSNNHRIVFDDREDEDGEEIKKNAAHHHDQQKHDSHYYSPSITSVVWSSCRGSTPNYRGYTCGLWMLFHTSLSSSQPRTVSKSLRAIHNYVLNFFMCLECRVHFSQFRFSFSESQSDQEAVLWLFHAHNAVNRRLALPSSSSSSSSPAISTPSPSSASTSSTDPLVPKLQFPPQGLCPGGCNSRSPDREVFVFLRGHYHWLKITRSLFCKDGALKQLMSSVEEEHHDDHAVKTKQDGTFKNIFFLFGFFIVIVILIRKYFDEKISRFLNYLSIRGGAGVSKKTDYTV